MGLGTRLFKGCPLVENNMAFSSLNSSYKCPTGLSTDPSPVYETGPSNPTSVYAGPSNPTSVYAGSSNPTSVYAGSSNPTPNVNTGPNTNPTPNGLGGSQSGLVATTSLLLSVTYITIIKMNF